MNKIRVNKIFIYIIIILIPISGFSNDILNINNSVFDSTNIQIQHINDVNFLFNSSITNDYAFTSSLILKYYLNQFNKNRKSYNFEICTDLYTSVPEYKFKEGDRLIRAQYFTEISYLSASILKLNQSYNFGYKIKSGIGYLNKKNPVIGLSLWIQGGEDGRHGIHNLLYKINKNPGQENLSRDFASIFLFVSPSLNKYFYIKSKKNHSPHIINSEFGIYLNTFSDAIHIFTNNSLRFHLIQIHLFKKLPLKIDLISYANLYVHSKGLKTYAGYGTEITLGKISTGYSRTLQKGNENSDWVDFSDKEDLYNLFLRYYF